MPHHFPASSHSPSPTQNLPPPERDLEQVLTQAEYLTFAIKDKGFYSKAVSSGKEPRCFPFTLTRFYSITLFYPAGSINVNLPRGPFDTNHSYSQSQTSLVSDHYSPCLGIVFQLIRFVFTLCSLFQEGIMASTGGHHPHSG